MTAKPLLLALTAAGALAVGGCGSGGYPSSSPDTASTAVPAAAAPATGGVKISMKDIAFGPKAVTVKVGQTITWVDEDSVDHNVTATSGADFKSKDFGQGGTFKYTPKKAGDIDYECTIHPGMTGKISVVD